jgi:CBS domain-containing protein
VTDRDIVIKIIAAEIEFNKLTVGDVMSYELVTAAEEDEIIETMKRMRGNGIRRLPVVNSMGGLEGITTVDDILCLIAEQLEDLAKLVTNQLIKEKQKD